MIDSIKATETEHFKQKVGDNINHNIRTLTGKGTFHDMGIISIRSNSNSNFKTISRRQHKSVTALIGNQADCDVKVEPYYGDSYGGLQKLYFTSMANLASTTLQSPTRDDLRFFMAHSMVFNFQKQSTSQMVNIHAACNISTRDPL